MKALLTVTLATMGGMTWLCLAADQPVRATTNVFSDWVGASSNVTVKTRALPWSGSRISHVVRAKVATQPPAVSPEALRLAQQRLDEELAKRRLEHEREKLLNTPPYTDTFQVHLSRE